MPEPITSVQNPKVKALVALQEKSRLRRETGLFVVEGRRELDHCLAAGYVPDAIYVCPAIAGAEVLEGLRRDGRLTGRDGENGIWGHDGPSDRCDGEDVFPRKTVAARGRVNGRGPTDRLGGTRTEGPQVFTGKSVLPANNVDAALEPAGPAVYEVSPAVYDKIAYRGGTEGIIATVHCRDHSLEDLQLPENPLIVVLESVEKPGNLGAVLRSADAARADAVIVCDPLTDLYNPNLIRASIGAVFTVPTLAVSSEEAIAWLRGHGIRILTAQLQDSSLYYDTDMSGPTALVMGTESTGLTDRWRQAADAHIRIPMRGALDSLNVSVSTAILLFEAVRQRLA